VRKALPRARIGFFLHIPFPPNDVFRVLPWREEILEGLLAADLVGFHVPQYADYFKDACRVVLGAETDGEAVSFAGHTTTVQAFPLGIDTKYWTELAAKPAVVSRAQDIRREANGRKIFVGVDRLDYTKGLLRRFTALEMLFEQEPELATRMRLIQVVFPSRTALATYSNLRRRIDETVGRINGQYATTSEAPVHLLSRNLSVEETASLYQAADVMLVTPVRDGMNLVAKEFVASRAREDGVLILSEFAGAAPYLPGAVVVNPYDIEEMAEQMRAAADMQPAEQTARMRKLREAVMSNDVTQWTESFLAALEDRPESAGARHARPLPPSATSTS
jgi:trehalose 6-phosphate synthase/phosphatase